MRPARPLRAALAGWAAVAALAGCELRKAPPSARGSAAGSADLAAAPPPDAAPAAPGAPAAVDSTARDNAARFQACSDAATHAIDLMIAMAPAASRAQLATERATLIEGMRDPCVIQKWSDAALACLRGAADYGALQKCRELMPQAATGAGSG